MTMTPELMDRLVKFRDEHEGEALGGVGTKLLFEDDRVRIWEMRLAPGEASDLHHHADDYYLAMLQGDMIEITGVEDFAGNAAGLLSVEPIL